MTNLQGSAVNPWITRLLLWGPIGVGGLLAGLTMAFGAVPLITQVQLQSRQQDEKRAQEVRLPQIRADLKRIAIDQQRVEGQQQRLLELIAGSGDLVTFMAQADREAQRHGVVLQLVEPTQAPAAAEAQAADNKQAAKPAEAGQAAPTGDTLEKAGLSSQQLLLSARGSYPDLLAFLRGLESLSLLVVQTNVSLGQEAQAASTGAKSSPSVTKPPELKLAIKLYSRKAKT